MIFSLITLVCCEMVLIGYGCVVRLESYSGRMAGILIGMLCVEGIISRYNYLQTYVLFRAFTAS